MNSTIASGSSPRATLAMFHAAQAHATIRRIYERERERADVVEFIAGMTDRFALHYAETIP